MQMTRRERGEVDYNEMPVVTGWYFIGYNGRGGVGKGFDRVRGLSDLPIWQMDRVELAASDG